MGDMIEKLTRNQAQDVMLRACADCKTAPTMRLGQAIWNHCPNELTAMYTGTCADFYEESDEGAACLMFMKHFVNSEVMEEILSES